MRKRKPDLSHSITQLEWLIQADMEARHANVFVLKVVRGKWKKVPDELRAAQDRERIRSYVDGLRALRAAK
jgi:hypothetical protein